MKKRVSEIAVLFLLLVGTLLAVTACKESVKEISVDRDHMPQTVFVLGNELDLSNGSLIVDGKSLPLSSNGIEVTGYNKDQAGQQTLTISYKGKTTELIITVVPRLQASDKYLYFVGEEMSAVQIALSFTRDDGTSFTVQPGDDGLTIENFSTETANDSLMLTATYQSGVQNYSGSFEIIVASPEFTFRKPRKEAYGSHETELDMTGATLTMKSADGKATRNIPLSELTASGYDPSVITPENDSARQTVSVSYGGRVIGSFEVTVSLSDVTRFHLLAQDLSRLDWSHYELPDEETSAMYLPEGFTEDMGKSAMDGLALYESLSAADQRVVLQDDLDAVVRLASVYGYNTWNATFNRAYQNIVSVEYGRVTYECNTRELAKQGYDRLSAAVADRDEDTALLYTYGDLLSNTTLLSRCGKTVIYQDAVYEGDEVDLEVSELVSLVYSTSNLKKVYYMLEDMLMIADIMETIPATWATDGVKTYANSIESIYSMFLGLDGSSASDTSSFDMLEEWREGNDLFELTYRYYFDLFLNGTEAEAKTASSKLDRLTDMRLPARVESVYYSHAYAYMAQISMQNVKSAAEAGEADPSALSASIIESTGFMYSYRLAVEDREELLKLNDDLYTYLYAQLLEPVMQTLRNGTCGYNDLGGSSSFDTDYQNLWDQYLYLWEAFQTDAEFVESEEFATRVEGLFEAFVMLRPIQQTNFLNSMNYLYENNIPGTALYPDENGLYSQFATFIYSYYLTELGVDLTDEATMGTSYDLFLGMMLSMEYYSVSRVTDFCETMTEVQELYESWTGAEKAVFDEHLKFMYDRYIGYLNMYEKTVDDKEKVTYVYIGTDLGDYQEIFDAIDLELQRVSVANLYLKYMGEITGQTIPMYLNYLSSYEHLRELSGQILSCGDEKIIRAYYYQTSGDGSYSFYESIYNAKGDVTVYLDQLGIDVQEYEKATGLHKFLSQSADYLWTSVEMLYSDLQIQNLGGEFEFTPENVNALMRAFRSLSPEARELVIMLDSQVDTQYGGMNVYYGGLEAYFLEALKSSKPVSELSSAMLNLEIFYMAYELYPDREIRQEDDSVLTTKELYLSIWDEVETAVESLNDDDKALFETYLGEMYAYYRQISQSLKAEA